MHLVYVKQIYMEHAMASALTFPVRRSAPELVGPAAPTPCETKRLSDIDDTWRFHVPLLFFYRATPVAGGADPASVIRRALGAALVPYYPLAGRLRELAARKLVVDCTGDGVVFVEADAGVRLAELEAAGLRPPFPYMDKLLCHAEGSGALDCPLLLIQVTRLLCGGFVLGLRVCHAMFDGAGLAQFLSALAELARGLPAPTVQPAWSRELLEARSPPTPAFRHREYDAVPPSSSPPPPPLRRLRRDMVTRTFTFRPAHIAAIKSHLPPRLRRTATAFEALAAALWRARTAAMAPPPGKEVRLVVMVNFRGLRELGLPAGYYGNAMVPSAAAATAGALLAGSLGDAVELVRRAKAAVTAEYVRSMADFLVLRGRPALPMESLYVVSDNRHAGFHRVDLGWGAPVYGGRCTTLFGASLVVAVEDAVAVPIMLPPAAMDRFAAQVETMLLASPGGSAAPALWGRL
ncbi:hypothetical protein ACP4OV_010820 [Aristida adscensionis]